MIAPAAPAESCKRSLDQILRKTLLKAFVLVYNQGQPEEGVYTLFVEVRIRKVCAQRRRAYPAVTCNVCLAHIHFDTSIWTQAGHQRRLDAPLRYRNEGRGVDDTRTLAAYL